MKKLLFYLTLFTTSLIYSQTGSGSIAGKITDKDYNNEPLAFATIVIKNTSIGAISDIDGNYSVKNLDPGVYTVVVSFVGYETIEVPNVKVENKKVTQVNIPIAAGTVSLDDVVISAPRRSNTESAVLIEMQQAKQIINAISSEQITRGTDGNAAEAVQRVPGVTIVDGKFVMIRGLNERYNNVLINNSIAPSTEVDKRTFSFDLIPTDAIDKILIYKTASADKPGDFSGGVISLTTSEIITDFTRVNIGVGYRNNSTFEDYFQSRGSATDGLGFDRNFRALPRGFPSKSQINDLPGVNTAANQLLQNNFNPTESMAWLDHSLGLSFGRVKNFENGVRLSSINSINHSNGYQYFSRQFNRYTTLNPGETRPPQWLNYIDDTYKNETKITALSNWILRLNENNTLKFKNLFNQIGENETILRTGNNFLQRGNDLFKNYLLGYKARTIYVGQFEGEHKLSPSNKIDWVLGGNYIYESEPDLRRFRTIQAADTPNAPFEMIDPASSNLFDTGRYFGQLEEYAFNNAANFTHTFNNIEDEDAGSSAILKAGYLVDYRKRNFDARYFSYLLPGYVTDNRNELKQLPLTDIFNAVNVNPNDGWILSEGTRPIDSYEASNFLTAGYLYAQVPLNKFDISGGVRVEHNIQQLNSSTDTEPVEVDNPITSVLPSFNVSYNLSDRSILRLAYGKTVNRPEFREIAPFVFYDYKNEAGRRGNSDLETAEIDNIDLRYEFYPNMGETMSLGLFYKNFKNPIENVTEITTEQPQFLYDNAESAYNYGVEIEIRKSFKDISDNPFISKLSTNINASYIVSEVDLGSNVTSQDQKRALQGQSPYIINAALGYEDENGFSANLIYNRFGDRIFSVGDNNFPTIYELSRDNIDFTISKKFKNVTYKLGIQDLLNAKYQFFEDSNRDEQIRKNIDNATSVFKRGTLFTFNVTYNLN
ncbi:TonB-dependent receptor [Confluentibacter citreus]|uniref:TonB-dependent receptor n=1 Tax=Confluentibacter citreus TaxID=2007307 RepID=UPI000C282A94|nr:TonB-dependent receptor [Confluentibacter citreus]